MRLVVRCRGIDKYVTSQSVMRCHKSVTRICTKTCRQTKGVQNSKVNQSYTKRDRRVTNVTKSVHMAKKNFYNFCVTMEQDPGHKKDLA
jgi:hypothetical protein